MVFTQTTNPIEQRFECQVCHRSYANHYTLNNHTRIHEDSRLFECDVCWKKFTFYSQLKDHYRTHTGEKPFACETCSKIFAYKSHLVQHQATVMLGTSNVPLVRKVDFSKQNIS